MELSLRQSVAIAPDVICREVGGELVMLNLESGTYFGLDPVGTRMWQLIETHGALEKVFDAMCGEYDVTPDTLERDRLGLVNQLCARGLARVLPQ
jgi:hypothetical protein